MNEKSYILGQLVAVAQKMEETVNGSGTECSLFTKENLERFVVAPSMNISYLEKYLVKFHKPLQEMGDDHLISESYRLYTELNVSDLEHFSLDEDIMIHGYKEYLASV